MRSVSIMSEDKAAQILAMVYCYTTEDFVFNEVFRERIATAKEVLGIEPMSRPASEAGQLIQMYIDSICSYAEIGTTPKWVEWYTNRYGLTLNPDSAET